MDNILTKKCKNVSAACKRSDIYFYCFESSFCAVREGENVFIGVIFDAPNSDTFTKFSKKVQDQILADFEDAA
jgi:hypothetical protein